MPAIDMNNAIRNAVAQEVTRVLGPHMDTLRRLSQAFGVTAPRRAEVPAARIRRRRRAEPALGARANAVRFAEGQKVIYRQGRGTFEATVTAIDAARNRLTLKREKDGKRVARPAQKVRAA